MAAGRKPCSNYGFESQCDILEIKTITGASQLLDSVIRLGDSNKEFLGFFPKKAFRRSADEGWVLCAVGHPEELCGYLLYYVARGRAVIQQLCVNPEKRREGVARALVNHLKELTGHLDGILLHSRRDFPAHEFWPQVGFVAVSEKPGRGKKQTTLTRYWYDHGHPHLFSASAEEEKVVAVLDANVLFDLQDRDESESAALTADWLNEHVELKTTHEVLNEINRQPDATERMNRRGFAQRFAPVQHATETMESALTKIKNVLPKAQKPSDKSDHRQLAMAISGGAEFFITRDNALCKHGDEVFQRFGIAVVRPTEFVLRFDELLRRADYQPVRLAGSTITIRLVGATDIPVLAETFLSYGDGEKKGGFESRLRGALAQPNLSTGALIESTPGEQLGFFVVCQERDRIFTIPFFRLKKGTLAPTLARNIAMLIVKQACNKTRDFSLTVVTDPHVDTSLCAALQDLGFGKSGNSWVKINCVGMHNPSKMASSIRSFSEKNAGHHDIVEAIAKTVEKCSRGDPPHDFTVRAEQRIWPGKLIGTGLPCFIVPIRPQWALHLFDEQLATQNLFGAVTKIALACENVYYRGKVPRVLQAPGRVLWYVSEDRHYAGSKNIRACSMLNEVLVGKAKDLFRRFQPLGIYDWRHVRDTAARGDPEREIMAFRFRLTEVLANPVSWEETKRILLNHIGTEPPLSTPLEVSEDCFEDIYIRGAMKL